MGAIQTPQLIGLSPESPSSTSHPKQIIHLADAQW